MSHASPADRPVVAVKSLPAKPKAPQYTIRAVAKITHPADAAMVSGNGKWFLDSADNVGTTLYNTQTGAKVGTVDPGLGSSDFGVGVSDAGVVYGAYYTGALEESFTWSNGHEHPILAPTGFPATQGCVSSTDVQAVIQSVNPQGEAVGSISWVCSEGTGADRVAASSSISAGWHAMGTIPGADPGFTHPQIANTIDEDGIVLGSVEINNPSQVEWSDKSSQITTTIPAITHHPSPISRMRWRRCTTGSGTARTSSATG